MAQDLTCLSDAELLVSLKALVCDERRHLVSVFRRLAEMDRRCLADKQGFPSLFDYCARELRYAEGEAARRIHAVRAAARSWPRPRCGRRQDRGCARHSNPNPYPRNTPQNTPLTGRMSAVILVV